MKNKIWGIICLILLSVLLFIDQANMDTIRYSSNDGYLIQHAGEAEEDIFSKFFVLEPGEYQIVMGYTSSEQDNYLVIRDNGIETERVYFNPSANVLEYTLHMEEQSSEIEIAAHYMGKGYLEVKDFSISPCQPWFHDSWLKVVTLWAIVIVLSALKRVYVKESNKQAEIQNIWIVLGTAALSSILLFSDNRVGFADDIQYHLTRIDGIAQGLRDGQFPVMIYPDGMQKNGYLNVMYPSLFLYFPAVLRILGVSFPVAYKVFLAVINFATAFSMYFSMKNITKSRKVILFATIMYMFMRYRLNNIYVRGAVGESLAMVFLPLIIAGAYQLIMGDRKKWWILAVGACGVIQSHILSVIIYAAIVAILIVVYIRKIIQEKRYIEIAKTVVVTVLLNLWFIIPFLIFYIQGNLNLDAVNKDFWSEAINPSYLLGIFHITRDASSGSARDFALRLPFILLLAFSIFYVANRSDKKAEQEKFLNSLFWMSCVMLLLATNVVPYRVLRDIGVVKSVFELLQFPWRLIGPAACMIVIYGAIWLDRCKVTIRYKNGIFLLLLAILLVDTSYWNLRWNENVTGYEDREANYEYRTVVTDKICWNISWFPDEYKIKGDTSMIKTTYTISSDDIYVQNYKKDKLNVQLGYITQASDEKKWIDVPLNHYLGYYAVDENGEEYELETSEIGNIRVLIHADGAEHSIYVAYKEPISFRIAEVISLISLIGIVIWGIIQKKNNKMRLQVNG